MSCFLMTTVMSSYIPVSVSEVLFVCETAAVFFFFFRDCAFVIKAFPKKKLLETGQLSNFLYHLPPF